MRPRAGVIDLSLELIEAGDIGYVGGGERADRAY